MAEITIIGAGITGLSCALYCKRPYVILEKERTPGGLCRSVTRDGFTFDYTGHFLHLRRPETKRLILRNLLRGDMKTVDRSAWVFSHRTFVPYPFQANLFRLPRRVKLECVEGFVDRPPLPKGRGPVDFHTWSLATFGAGITRHFMEPYNEKIWAVSTRKLTADWVAPFVPQPSLEEVIGGALEEGTAQFGYNRQFYYPEQGGSQKLIDAFVRRTGNLKSSTAVERIHPDKKFLETSSGERIHYRHLVSTMPLPELIARMSPVPAGVRAAAKALAWNSVTCLNIAVRSSGPLAGGRHWVYFPEDNFAFYRVGIYTNVAPSMAPVGYASLYAEISRRPDEPVDYRELLARTMGGLRSAGIVNPNSRIEVSNILDIPCAYVIYDRKRAAALSVIRKFLASRGVHAAGRYGEWKYSFMEESITDAAALMKTL